MRKAFNEELLKAARQDKRIHMILADIGYGEIEPFANEFPERFINCGVAEQNMTGVACGVALAGNIAITYSIANFPTLRCLEQVRNDVCYHNANVKIVIISGGMAYGPLGVSHHSTEDLAIMRALPNLKVIAPCDIYDARSAVHAMLAYDGPVYYRCGYKGEKNLHTGPVNFEIGKALKLREGKDAAIIFTGTIGINALQAADELEKQGYSIKLISMHTVKPIDVAAVLDAAETGCVVTLEEHNICGGMGGAVAEALMDNGAGNIRFKRMALPDVNVCKIGSEEWLRDQYGLGVADIVSTVKSLVKK
ncbi:MAG: transketolase [Lentisphaeria bacterium]|nr:transketolase [Lentisphaeria bacterium]